ncbi:MAG: Nramp family divalent metal transporter [Acidobacteriota bacterium]
MNKLKARITQVGPALVLAAVVLGPGSITLNTIAGSLYGYQLLWVPIVATAFMIVYSSMSARVGLLRRQTLFQAARLKYGSRVAQVGGLFAFLTTLAFQAGNNAGIGFSMNALLGQDVRLWAGLFFLPAFGLILLPRLYEKLELLVKLVVGLMIIAFFSTLLIVGVDAGESAAGLLPKLPDQSAFFLALGMVATTFSIVAAAYQSYLMREKDWGPEHLSTQGLDTFLGIAILGAISTVILMTSAQVIHGSAEPVFSAQAMALQLEPLVGSGAFFLFTAGFFFASLSSLVVNPLIGATLLVDAFGGDPSMNSFMVKLWTGVAMAAGLLVVLVFGGSPIELLRVAQALAVVAFPLLGFLLLSIAGDRKLMGKAANSTFSNVVGVLGYITLLGIVLNYIRQILGEP